MSRRFWTHFLFKMMRFLVYLKHWVEWILLFINNNLLKMQGQIEASYFQDVLILWPILITLLESVLIYCSCKFKACCWMKPFCKMWFLEQNNLCLIGHLCFSLLHIIKSTLFQSMKITKKCLSELKSIFLFLWDSFWW